MFKRIMFDVLKMFLGFGVAGFHGAHIILVPPQTPYEGFITHSVLAVTLLAGLVVGIEGLRDLIKASKE
jgi:hypothetical protein